ncbi:MAG: adenylate kinase [Elusimicrobia bacterium]|nr:adenylate kinase [Elusimicrobiota bacterium]
MILVLLGPPGSGKGTQAKELAQALRLPVVASGELFRQAVASGSPLGVEVAQYLQGGRLVPDHLTVRVLHERLTHTECQDGCLLDGYPRTLDQAHALEQFLSGRNQAVDLVLYFQVTPEQVVARLSQRRVCRTCGRVYNLRTQPPATPDQCDGCGGNLVTREDDQPTAIQERLRVYERQTAPVVSYYQRLGRLTTVDAAQGIAQVAEAIQRTLRQHSRAS